MIRRRRKEPQSILPLHLTDWKEREREREERTVWQLAAETSFQSGGGTAGGRHSDSSDIHAGAEGRGPARRKRERGGLERKIIQAGSPFGK